MEDNVQAGRLGYIQATVSCKAERCMGSFCRKGKLKGLGTKLLRKASSEDQDPQMKP